MYVNNVDGVLRLFEVEEGLKVIAFGNFYDQGCAFLFAFLVKEDVVLKAGTEIKGVQFAEGIDNDFEIMDTVLVDTTRNQDGSYTFRPRFQGSKLKMGEFFLQQTDRGISTYEGVKLSLLTLRDAD